MPNLSLNSLNVKKEICDIFSSLGYNQLSLVQEKTIPILLKKKSVLVVSETGSGKTFSYLIPILNLIDFNSKSIEAIILLPTNILVDQIKEVITSFTNKLGYGDEFVKAIKSKKDFSKSNPKIIISTLSFYQDIFSHYPTNDLKNVIIDEGDMLIFDGFSEIITILKRQIDKKIVSIFSASIKKQDITRIKSTLKISEVVEVSNKITSSNVSHVLIDYFPLIKKEALLLLLNQKEKYFKTIVFFKTINELNEISKYLKENKINFYLLHGELDKREIKKILNEFDKLNNGILLASDYLSRGIDCKNVDLVISYSLPKDLDYYFHRAGRTGRFSKDGISYILVNKDDENDLKAIKTLNRRGLTFSLVKLNKNGLKDLPTSYIFKNLGKKDQSNDLLQKKIRHAVNKNKSDKVKPNYKKKVSKAVKRVKEKHRMKVVRTNIAKSGGNVKDFHQDY